ncbi:hypothetical protein MMP66_07885 [Acinetobacter dispersus]|uniref:hypothetical protein n=1 Tax=Acinetobacter dispersus TaxID=70348 RepID=UPI001F4B773F|nr:hypothetical protein [Acinetobacter dispersus]MCH7394200.1 hypothetical protein [Acinetobacter dispersus]
MDLMCTIDWGLLFKLLQIVVPIGIAISVYLVWHKQKEKEVIAVEAKSIIMEMFELNKIFSDLYNHNYTTTEELIEKMKSFKAQRWFLIAKLSFLRNCISNKKFKEWVNDFNDETIKINNLINPYLVKGSKKDMLEFSLVLEIMNSEIDEEGLHPFRLTQIYLLEACKDLAMYRPI